MKQLSTEITTKKGERKIITVDVDDIYADWLVTQPQEIYHDAVMFEYRTSCTERKETRYIQSLDASMDNGFDIADESSESAEDMAERLTLEDAIRKLTEQQQWVVKQVFMLQRKQVEVARELGITESAMAQQISVIKRNLKKILKNF